jgi:hypothetical protein
MTDRKGTYRLINFGQQVDTGELSESGINVSALETGVYILEVNDGQKTVAKKFVKINSIINRKASHRWLFFVLKLITRNTIV